MVYVISKNGQPIMPTSNHRKVRLLLKSGKAKVVKRTPFTIRLTGTSKTYKQDITLGVDAGSKHIGLSASTEKQELFAAECQPRNDVVKLLSARREFRRSRRNRTTRYRQARFDNRVHSKHKGWLAPSVEVKIYNHQQAINFACKILPITKIRVETAEFDTQLLKAQMQGKSAPKGIEYQYGEMFDEYNIRQYILKRDNYTCTCCNKHGEGIKLYVVHAEDYKTSGEAPDNNYTLCKECFVKAARGEMTRPRHRLLKSTKDAVFMGIMRDTLLARLRAIYNIPVEQTYGYITKGMRELYDIPKSHVNDALCISGHPKAVRADRQYAIVPKRTHNRQIHKATILKGGYRKLNQTPKYVFGYRLFDKVSCNEQAGFIFGRRASGYFDVRRLDGTKISAGIHYSKLRLLERQTTLLVS